MTSVIAAGAAAKGAPGYFSKLPREAAAVDQARSFVRAVLTTWRLGGVLEDSVLIASELATNAVVHGSGSAMRMEVTRPGPNRVRIAVTDESIRQPSRRNPAQDESSGRGLFLVEAFSCTWGTDLLTHSKTVWAELDANVRLDERIGEPRTGPVR